MSLDWNFTPFLQILLVSYMVSLSGHILIDYFSSQFALATRRFQIDLFKGIGQSSIQDFILFVVLQLVSFRKRAYFNQLSALINVRTFSVHQNALVILASLMGWGMSLLILTQPLLALSLVIILGFWSWRTRFSYDRKHLMLSVFYLGLFFVLMVLFDVYFSRSGLKIHDFSLSPLLVFLTVIVTSVFFSTPLVFLTSLGFLYLFMDIQIYWFPVFFFVHSVLTLVPFYLTVFKGRSRTHHSLFVTIVFQLLQLAISLFLFRWQDSILGLWSEPFSFISSLRSILVFYAVYSVVPLLFVFPWVFLSRGFLFFSFLDKSAHDTQKIIYDFHRQDSFSIHLSIFFLKLEFKKYLTTVLTFYDRALLLSSPNQRLRERFDYYYGILVRVGEEIKELCLKITEHKAPRDIIDQIMFHYREINKLYAVVDALRALVAEWLRLHERHPEGWPEHEQNVFSDLMKAHITVYELYFNRQVGLAVEHIRDKRYDLAAKKNIFDSTFVSDAHLELRSRQQLVMELLLKLEDQN